MTCKKNFQETNVKLFYICLFLLCKTNYIMMYQNKAKLQASGILTNEICFWDGGIGMAEVRFLPPAAKYIKKLKDKKLKMLYQKAIDRIREDPAVGEAKTGDLSGVYGYDIYYNKTNYELAYTVEYLEDKIIVVIMAGTRENFYDQLKVYMKNP